MVLGTNQSEPNKTQDTSLAAYLYTQGFKILDIDYSSDRATILFANNDKTIEEHKRLYYIGKASVDPSDYSRTLKRLNKIIRNRIPWVEGVINA